MDQRIPPILHPLLQSFTQRAEQVMAEQIRAFYLEGSIALDVLNPRLSDVDFTVDFKSKGTPNDFNNILKLHKII